MTIEGLFVHLLRVCRAGTTVDRYGNTVKDWAADDWEEYRGWVSQASAAEIGDQREGQVSDWRLFLPTGTPISGGDRVEWIGETPGSEDITFEVIGPPSRPWRPGSGEHHVEADLRVVEG